MSEYLKGPFEKLRDREFDDPDVVKVLSGMSVATITDELGAPHVLRQTTPTRGNWTPGQGRPALATDDPAVGEAMGRCAASRSEWWGDDPRRPRLPPIPAEGHPRPCAWCEYPLHALLAACDHAVWRMQFVESELLVWYRVQSELKGPKYVRPGTTGGYQHPAWRDFWALPTFERLARIRAAQYPSEEAAA